MDAAVATALANAQAHAELTASRARIVAAADDTRRALVETGATIAFDAIGGGKLAGQIRPIHSGVLTRLGEDELGVGGYIVGPLDTHRFEKQLEIGRAHV